MGLLSLIEARLCAAASGWRSVFASFRAATRQLPQRSPVDPFVLPYRLLMDKTKKSAPSAANSKTPAAKMPSRKHKLLTKADRADLPSLNDAGTCGDHTVAVTKFFCPWGRFTFFVTAFDGDDLLFGYCVSPLGADCDEWGYASLSELDGLVVTIAGVDVPGIERDLYFTPAPVAVALRDLGVRA